MLAFHIGPDVYEKTHPYRAARIARAFPDTPVLMVHMGMTDRMMNKAVRDAAGRCPNMHLVGSACDGEAVLAAVKELGAHRVLFGTDRPFRSMEDVLTMYERDVKPYISPNEWKMITGGNGEKLFG